MKAIRQDQRHILILPSWYFDKDSEGIFIHEHARMTAETGCQVGVIYTKRTRVWKSTATEFYQADQINVGILESYHPPKVLWTIWIWKRKYLQLFQEYSAKFGTPDVIHAHGYVAGMAARYLSQHTSIPYVITEHNTTIPAQSVAWYHASELRRSYRDASALVAVSEYLKRAMQGWAGNKEISVIYNPIDFRRFQIDPTRSPHQTKQLIAIGSLEPRKNYHVLLEAMAILQKDFTIHLKLIGSGSELILLQKRASDLGLMSLIEWIPHQSSTEIARHVMQSDILISSSTLETFGIVIVEALACGVPVVATRSGAPEEYLDGMAGRIVPVNDAESIATATKYIFDHPHEFIAHEIRASAQKKFDFPVIGVQVNALYVRILKVT